MPKHSLIKIILAVSNILFMAQFAFAETHCICQVGTTPAIQRPFFKMGCNMWLKEQPHCDSKQVIDFPENLYSRQRLPIPPSARGGQLVLGYVGHWVGFKDSYGYIFNTIAPAMKELDLDVTMDNTACKGADSPETLSLAAQAFPVLFPDGKTLKYKANQVTSIGMWDRLSTVKSINIDATVEFPSGNITYPSCTQFLNQDCSGSLQAYQFAMCQRDGSQSQTPMRCCPHAETDFYDQRPLKVWRWTPDLMKACQR